MKSIRQRQISYDTAYKWNLNKQTNKQWYRWMYLQDRNRITDVENKLMVTSRETGVGGREGGKNLEIWIDI